MATLLDVPPAWAQLLDEDDEGGLTVLELDEAAAEGAPWEGFGIQLAVSVTLQAPDPHGQPYDDEHEVLAGFRQAIDDALSGQGRVVATVTMDGVREHVAYVCSAEVVQAWRTDPPAAFASHDAQVQLLDDPQWSGLLEMAGELPDGEPPLRPAP